MSVPNPSMSATLDAPTPETIALFAALITDAGCTSVLERAIGDHPSGFDEQDARQFYRDHVARRRNPTSEDDFVDAARTEDAALRLHKITAAVLVQALHTRTAGSGYVDTDAAELVRQAVHVYGDPAWATPPPRRQDVIRQQFARQRKTLAAIVHERDRYRCVRCGTTENLTVDHVHPMSRGGTNDLDNLQTLCGSCNSSKGNRTGVAP